MKIQARFLAAAVLVLSAAMLTAADIKIIANPGFAGTSISAEELKNVFLINVNTMPDGSHVEPVLEKDGVAHESFVKEYLYKTTSGLQVYYRSLAFTGKASIPKMFSNDEEVIAYVAKTKGAVAYVSAGASTGSVKVLSVK